MLKRLHGLRMHSSAIAVTCCSDEIRPPGGALGTYELLAECVFPRTELLRKSAWTWIRLSGYREAPM
jgi:hypothetical protein